jgi:hypothetical protein
VFFCVLCCDRPNPSIAELETAAEEFCAMPWANVSAMHRDNKHPHTYKGQLPDRCMQSLYIVTLLEKAFGFDRHERSITLALEVRPCLPVIWCFLFSLRHHGQMFPYCSC